MAIPILALLVKKLAERQMNGQAQKDGQNATNLAQQRMAETQGTSTPGAIPQDIMQANQMAWNDVFGGQTPTATAPQQTPVTTPIQNAQEKSTLESYQDYLKGQNKYSNDVINGVAKGLNSGYKEIADWQNQYANSAEAKQNGFSIPKTEAEIALAKSNDPKIDGGIKQENTVQPQKGSWIDNLANALGDIRAGYEENRDNAFQANNMYSSNNNSFMKHIGEGAGTLARMASNPTLQGVVAGLATGALTGNPLAGVMNGYNMAHKKANSNMYQDMLKKDGIDVKKGGYAGDVGLADYQQFSNVKTQREANEKALKQLEERIRHEQAMEDYYMGKLDLDKDYKGQKIEIEKGKLGVAKQNANTKEYSAHNKGSGGKTKPQEHPDYGKDLAGYVKLKGDPRMATKINTARALFIEKHKIDPENELNKKR